MATTNILGLFATPEQYQAQQAAQEQARALQFASMTPLQAANYNLFLGGQQLGRGLGGLLGAQDPQLRLISQRQQLMQSINPADPDSLTAGIQRANELGDQQLALTLTDYRNKQMSEMAQAQQRLAAAGRERQQAVPADIAKARELGVLTTALSELEKTPVGTPGREQQIAMLRTQIDALKPPAKAGEQIKELVIADEIVKLEDVLRTAAPDSAEARNAKIKLDLLKGSKKDQNQIKELVLADEVVKLRRQVRDAADPNSPEVLDAKDKLAVLEQQLKKDKPNLTVVGEVKSGVDKGKAVYVDENNDQQFVYEFDKTGKQVRKPFVGDVDRITSQVTATATSSAKLPPGVNEVVTGLGKLDVEDMKTARDNKRAAVASNQALKKLSELNDAGLISGAFAPSRVGATNFLNTLGLLSRSDASRLAVSEQYQKVGSDLVFQSLQGKLGTGVSNADRDFIEKIFPRLENSAAARRELIQYLANKNNDIIRETDAAESYLRKNKSFEGYTPQTSGVFDVAPTNLKNMSRTELEEAYKAAKKRGR